MDFNYKGFKLLCQTPCYELLDWLFDQLKELYDTENIAYFPRWAYFKGDSPVCLVAHLDTVHQTLVKEMYIEPEKQIIQSPQGIGGDDRCGVWIILKVLQSLEEGKGLPSLFFSTDEECGSASTKLACEWIKEYYPSAMDDVRFFIQLDRKNKEDSVYYNCDNKDFMKYINEYGFKTAAGSRTDICILCEQFDKAGVNLSCGFEGEHHVTEYVDVNTMLSTTEKVLKIIEEAQPDVIFDYSPKIKTYSSGVGRNYVNGVWDYDNY